MDGCGCVVRCDYCMYLLSKPNLNETFLQRRVVEHIIIKGYPQRMRLQRRLYGVYIPYIQISCNCKLISFFAKSLYKPLD